ncbi:hypothetical protein PATSB16_09590 [Pandoraea thiooxydans]|nr:hypothetical protein PATSB16_09590 [Pandoraea thiooxydans]
MTTFFSTGFLTGGTGLGGAGFGVGVRLTSVTATDRLPEVDPAELSVTSDD